MKIAGQLCILQIHVSNVVHPSLFFFFDVKNTNMKDYIFILTLLNIFNN